MAERTEEGPAATTDKEPDLEKAPTPPKKIPPPATPCLVDTVGVSASAPPATVVPLETVMSVAVLKRVVLVKVTSLLPVTLPELKAAKAPL